VFSNIQGGLGWREGVEVITYFFFRHIPVHIIAVNQVFANIQGGLGWRGMITYLSF
jgi:hypothetical protein